MNHQDLINIAREHGSPVYVYDAEVIIAQYERLVSAFAKAKQLRVHYAVKALSNI